MFERLEGPAFPAELTAAPAAGSEGHPVSLTLVIRDLSGRKQLEDTIDQLRRQNDALLEASGDGVVGIDLWGRVTFVNAGLQRLTGYSADELVGQSLHQVLHGGSDAAAGHSNEQCSLYAVLRERAPQQIHDESILSKGGNALSVDYSATPIRQGGKLAGAMIVVRPVRSPGIDQATPPVASNQDGLSALLASAPLPAAVTDAAGVYVDVNEAYCALLGYERSELTGTHFFSIIPENNRDKFATLYEQWIGARLEATDEHDVLTRDGRTITVLETSMPLGDNEVRSRVSFLLDVTARKAADQKAERAAQNDPITSLPSLPIFHDRLIQALAYANRHGQLVGLLHLDIDGFSQINDELGSNVGDLLLHEVAQRLETVTRDLDTVARIRGDDFVVILPDVGSAQNAATVARKILAEFARGFAVFGEPMTVTASIGISLFPFDGTEGDSLLASSEAGMYRAKEEGGNTLVFYGAGVD
jgi:diguanylate cyclase (GGDEF)-like protein/PAS domain S-box-containing protein